MCQFHPNVQLFSSKDQVSGCGYCIILDNGHDTVTSPTDISRSFCGIAIFKTHKPSRCNILWKPPLLWLKKPPRDEFKITTVLVKNGIILKAGLSSGYLVCLFGEKKWQQKADEAASCEENLLPPPTALLFCSAVTLQNRDTDSFGCKSEMQLLVWNCQIL